MHSSEHEHMIINVLMLFITIFLRNTCMHKCVKIKFHLKRIVIISIIVTCMYLHVECWTYHWIKTVMIEVHYISIHVFQSRSTVSQLTIYLYKYFIMKNSHLGILKPHFGIRDPEGISGFSGSRNRDNPEKLISGC